MNKFAKQLMKFELCQDSKIRLTYALREYIYLTL